MCAFCEGADLPRENVSLVYAQFAAEQRFTRFQQAASIGLATTAHHRLIHRKWPAGWRRNTALLHADGANFRTLSLGTGRGRQCRPCLRQFHAGLRRNRLRRDNCCRRSVQQRASRACTVDETMTVGICACSKQQTALGAVCRREPRIRAFNQMPRHTRATMRPILRRSGLHGYAPVQALPIVCQEPSGRPC